MITREHSQLSVEIPSKTRWRVFTAGWLGNACEGYDSVVYMLCMFPIISELTGSSNHALVGPIGSIVLALFMVGWAVGGAAFGLVADKWGRVWSLVLSIALYSLATGLSSLCHTWQELAFYRCLTGLGVGGQLSVSATLIEETWQGNAKTHVLAALVAAIAVGQVIASGINSCQVSWRLMFALGALPALLALLVRVFLSESQGRAKAARHIDLSSIISRRNVTVLALLSILTTAATIESWVIPGWISSWINQLTGSAATEERSLTLTVMTIAALISCSSASFLVLRFGAMKTIRWGILAASAVWIVMYSSIHSFSPALLVLCFLGCYACVLPGTVLFMYIPACFAPTIRATACGLSFTVGRLAAAVFALLGASLLQTFNGSYPTAGIILSVVCLLGALATFWTPQDQVNKTTVQ